MAVTQETKILVAILIVTLLIIVGGAFFSANRQKAAQDALNTVVPTDQLIASDSPVLGPNDAKVTIVEFGDFQCPACGSVHPILKQLKADYKDQSVRWVFRHFPLPQHPDAPLAAEAAVAAQQQGKFWEMHDQLFEHQNDLSRGAVEKYAGAVGLNMDQFKKALDDRTYKDAVNTDQHVGDQIGVNATPTIFVNGKQYTQQFSVDEFKKVIDEELNK